VGRDSLSGRERDRARERERERESKKENLICTHMCKVFVEKRPTSVKRDLLVSKETYKCQKRPTSVKRDLLVSKETY